MENTLPKVGEAIIEKSVGISIDVQPKSRLHQWLQRNRHTGNYFPVKKHFSMRPITYGNMQRISSLLLQIDLSKIDKESFLDSSYQVMKNHSDTIIEIIATAIANSKAGPSKALKSFLKWNLTAEESMSLLVIVLKQTDVQNFLHTIVSIRGLNVLQSVENKNA